VVNGLLDAHVHLWDRARHPQAWIDPATMSAIDRDFAVPDLTAMLAATGRTSGVLVQATNSLPETIDLLALAGSAPVSAVVGWIDLTADVPEQVAALRAGPGGTLLRGVRHLAHMDPDPEWLLRSDVAAGLEDVAAAGLSFDLVVRPDQLRGAVAVVHAHPDVRFVLDHLGNPPIAESLHGWRRNLRALAAAPNAVAKLSGILMAVRHIAWSPADLAPVFDTALEVFTPSRLMYGSDWPVVRLAGGAVRWAAAVDELAEALSESERQALLAGTCAAAYRIAT
jgi:L-fuconolactonase